MLSITLFIKGLLIGISIAAPVGPIGLLCISKTISKGRLAGLITGLGAATADGIYGAIAGFGLKAITNSLTTYELYIKLIGGIFLLYLGYKTIRHKTPAKSIKIEASSLKKEYLTTVFLTLTNPTTILSFMAIFAGVGLVSTESYLDSSLLVLGVFIGSAIWWLILSGITSKISHKLKPKHLKLINTGSGLLILSFGLLSIFSII